MWMPCLVKKKNFTSVIYKRGSVTQIPSSKEEKPSWHEKCTFEEGHRVSVSLESETGLKTGRIGGLGMRVTKRKWHLDAPDHPHGPSVVGRHQKWGTTFSGKSTDDCLSTKYKHIRDLRPSFVRSSSLHYKLKVTSLGLDIWSDLNCVSVS